MKTAVIGSSPLLLIEAYYRSCRGESVTVYERTSYIGGSWAKRHLALPDGGIMEIECACHLLENRRGTYGYLENLGVALADCRPQPHRLYYPSSFRLHYNSRLEDLRKSLFVFLSMIKGAVLGSPERVRDGLKNLRSLGSKLLVGIRGRKIRYFTGGSIVMIDRLLELCIEAGVKVELESDVKAVYIATSGRGHLCVGDATNKFEHLVVGDASIPKIFQIAPRQNVPVGESARSSKHYHHHFLFEGDHRRLLSYIQFEGHPKLHRVSVTGYSSTGGDSYTALSVNLRCPCSSSESLARLRDLVPSTRGLTKLGCLEDEFTSWDASRSWVEVKKMLPESAFTHLRSFGDLTRSFHAHGLARED